MASSIDAMRTSQEVRAKQTNDALAANKVQPTVGPRLEQADLGEQMHTPFNARELMWHAYESI